jgi:hypothetical protein
MDNTPAPAGEGRLSDLFSLVTLTMVASLGLLALFLAIESLTGALGGYDHSLHDLYLVAGIGLVIGLTGWATRFGRLCATLGFFVLGTALLLAGSYAGLGTPSFLPSWFFVVPIACAGLPLVLPLPRR